MSQRPQERQVSREPINDTRATITAAAVRFLSASEQPQERRCGQESTADTRDA